MDWNLGCRICVSLLFPLNQTLLSITDPFVFPWLWSVLAYSTGFQCVERESCFQLLSYLQMPTAHGRCSGNAQETAECKAVSIRDCLVARKSDSNSLIGRRLVDIKIRARNDEVVGNQGNLPLLGPWNPSLFSFGVLILHTSFSNLLVTVWSHDSPQDCMTS